MIPERQLERLGRAVANVGRDDLAGGVVGGRCRHDRILHGPARALDLVRQLCRVLSLRLSHYEIKAVFELPVLRRRTRFQHGSVFGTPFKRDWIMRRDTEDSVTNDARYLTGAFHLEWVATVVVEHEPTAGCAGQARRSGALLRPRTPAPVADARARPHILLHLYAFRDCSMTRETVHDPACRHRGHPQTAPPDVAAGPNPEPGDRAR